MLHCATGNLCNRVFNIFICHNKNDVIYVDIEELLNFNMEKSTA